ncbi:MAG: putative sulfate exporter family transporter [Chromatiales bacterium]
MQRTSEDWVAVYAGLLVFLLSAAAIFGFDLLGWSASAKVWMSPAEAIGPVAKSSAVPPALSVLGTYLLALGVMGAGAWLLGLNLLRFAAGFTVLFALAVLCWIIGHYAYIAATPDKLEKFGIGWSLNLTGESGYILALLLGLVIGNFLTGVSARFNEAVRPELFIKTAIVIMGAALGVKAAETFGLAKEVMWRGLCAVIEAYLIYWAVTYFIARRWFRFSREWAAPLASGISICGVSAAIATGAAIRARPIVAVMVSSLVVIFAVIELLILPFLAQHFLTDEPMVAGAWMGLAVKTDGAAIPAGAIADSLLRARILAEQGVAYQDGWISMATTTTKIFIDVFIGIWAFLLAVIWTTVIEPKPGVRVSVREIWDRFPKFVLGYVLTFVIMLWWCLDEKELIAAAKPATDEATVYRQIFFLMTFLCIGMVSHFGRLREEGIGRLAAVYAVSLFGFIIWFGLFISWLFFAGVKPPLAGAAG